LVLIELPAAANRDAATESRFAKVINDLATKSVMSGSS
jgi:hypothetical protein